MASLPILGKIITKITNKDDEIHFYCSTGAVYVMNYSQSCCESVQIENIEGDLANLIGNPVLIAEEISSQDFPPIFKFATIKGYVDIRWYGKSNGNYSEMVDFTELTNPRRFTNKPIGVIKQDLNYLFSDDFKLEKTIKYIIGSSMVKDIIE
jgi:hypothetical protein